MAIEQSLENNKQKKEIKYSNKAIQYFKAYLKDAPKGRFAVNCVEKWTALNRKLNNEDNLLIAKIYQDNNDYKILKDT